MANEAPWTEIVSKKFLAKQRKAEEAKKEELKKIAIAKKRAKQQEKKEKELDKRIAESIKQAQEKAQRDFEQKLADIKSNLETDPNGFYEDIRKKVLESNPDPETQQFFKGHKVQELVSISVAGYTHLRLQVILPAMCNHTRIITTNDRMAFGDFMKHLRSLMIVEEKGKYIPYKIEVKGDTKSKDGKDETYSAIYYPVECLPDYWKICRLHFPFHFLPYTPEYTTTMLTKISDTTNLLSDLSKIIQSYVLLPIETMPSYYSSPWAGLQNKLHELRMATEILHDSNIFVPLFKGTPLALH